MPSISDIPLLKHGDCAAIFPDHVIIDRMARAMAEGDGLTICDGGDGWYAVTEPGGTARDRNYYIIIARRQFHAHRAMMMFQN